MSTETGKIGRDAEETMLKYSWSQSKILRSAVFDEIQLHQQFTEYFHNEYRSSDCEDAVVIRKHVQRGYGDATRSLKAVILLHL